MPNLTLFGWMFLAWSFVTFVLGLIFIYRSVVGMKEDDLLYLNAASVESQFQKEQAEILAKLRGTEPVYKGFGLASAGLLAAMVLLVVYQVTSSL